MTTRSILGVLMILITGAVPGPPSAAAQETTTEKILRNADTVGFGACKPDDLSTGGCCGAPGRRGCSTLPTCTDPSGNKLRIEPFSGSVICLPKGPSCSPLFAANQLVAQMATGPLDASFYLTSDIHYFREAFRLADQVRHVRMLNQFAGWGQHWPAGVGFPDIAMPTPMGVVIAGDLTTTGVAAELAAYRLLYEGGNTADSINYQVFQGLGNHDIGDIDHTDQRRMFDYVASEMGCATNLDTVSHSYSWDWGRLHIVQLNYYGGYVSKGGVVPSNLPWLINDLNSRVGDSERPVIIIQHLGCDAFSIGSNVAGTTCEDSDPNAVDDKGKPIVPWWTAAQRQALLNVIKPYNIIGLFTGHSHYAGINRVYDLKDSDGNPVIRLDDYMNGAGGTDDLDPGALGGDDHTDPGHGEFFVVRVTDSYLDVAGIRWSDPAGPLTDDQRRDQSNEQNEIGPTTKVSPPFVFNQSGRNYGCRKRIGDRFITVPTANYALSAGSGTMVSVKNVSGKPIPGPIALRISGATTPNISFVDTCVADSVPFGAGPSQNDRSYVLLNLSLGQSLAPGATATVDAGIPFAPASMDLVVLTPIHGSTAPNGINVMVAPKGTVAPGTVTVYGPPNQVFAVSATGDEGLGWLIPGPAGGKFDAYGRATLTYNVNMQALANASVGGITATIQLFTLNNDAQGTPLSLGIPFTLTFKLPVSLNLTGNPGFARPTEPKVTFRSVMSFTRYVDPGNDGHVPTGEIDLYEVIPGAGRTLLTRAFVPGETRDGQNCNAYPFDNGSETAIFGDSGDGNYCPSVLPTSSTAWKFNLPAGLHQLVASFPGNGFYMPADSAPIFYRVGQPISSMRVISGAGQTTVPGAPFDYPIFAQVLDANSKPVQGVAMSFAFPPTTPSATFNGSPEWAAFTDFNGIATTNIPSASSGTGTYNGTAQITEPGSPSLTTQFSMTTQAAAPGAPAITAAVVLKMAPVIPGSANDRQWDISLKNSGGSATSVQLTSLQFTQESGPACTPVVDTALPAAAPSLLQPGSSGAIALLINFSSCSSTARFTATIGVSANGGAYTNQSVIAHQFQ